MNSHQSLHTSLKALALAEVIEIFFTAISIFLNHPPIEQRARYAVKEISKNIAKDAVGLIVPGSSTIATVYKLFSSKNQSQKLVSLATNEYERFLHLEDAMNSLQDSRIWNLDILQNSIKAMISADKLTNEALKMISFSIDLDKIKNSSEIDIIKLIHSF